LVRAGESVDKFRDAYKTIDVVADLCKVASTPSWVEKLLGGVRASAACGDKILTILNSKGKILGKNGVQTASKTMTSLETKVGGKSKVFRVDVENSNPLQGIPASIHIQASGENFKYVFNPQNGKLYSDISGIFYEESNNIQKLLLEPEIQKGIDKALTQYLSELPFFNLK
jgi:hypothetical protein